ncbi:MAG: DNA topology modulation protein FlaR [Bacilli bacterium]|nr:DNA topology modulation protein FlaR [Bacilli bacterium]
MRILIIGYAGSGKSTLAKRLGRIYNVNVLHLDNAAFNEDFTNKKDEEMTLIVKDFLDKNESWVIDGNYSRICPERFELANQIIYLNFNRFFCYFSALKRYINHRGKIRDSFPCTERFGLEFQKWILYKGRTKAKRKRHLDNLNRVNGEKIIFKNRRQVNKYLKKLEQSN